MLSHHIEAGLRMAQKGSHAGADDFGQQPLPLGLQRHRRVETGNVPRIRPPGEPDAHQSRASPKVIMAMI
jgi:hypothetical protein